MNASRRPPVDAHQIRRARVAQHLRHLAVIAEMLGRCADVHAMRTGQAGRNLDFV